MEIIVSAIIGFLVALFFYWLASKSMIRETRELARLNMLMLRAMEQAGLAEFNRDKQGSIIGLILNLRGRLTAESSTKATLSITHSEKPKQDTQGPAAS